MTERIKMSHGSGGRLMHRLIADVFVSRFGAGGGVMEDAAELALDSKHYAFTTDSFVVKPLFFPGGDIGKLAVCGTVNDLAARGARPEFLSVSMVIEEGLPIETLERIADSMAAAASEAGVRIVTGDTKVVERGSADGLFINTAGLGRILEGIDISAANARPGDRVILTGSVADHGTAVMQARENLLLSGRLESDCASLGGLVEAALKAAPEVHVLRDPTRGGLATTLVEIADGSRVRIVIDESKILVREPVRIACDMLGLDPLYVANEGKMIAIVPGPVAERFLAAVRNHPLGREAAEIGAVEPGGPGVTLKTLVGGRRKLIMLEGDPLPRIC
jgi:hydrogenase expression/formation protein HypE